MMQNHSYETVAPASRMAGNPYVGRGIILGLSPDGASQAAAYFIMGRSRNSRNRIFVREGDDLKILPHDPSKVEDPSLIIYYPVRKAGDILIVTNGDQTDTIYDEIEKCGPDGSFERALRTRTFEPDNPNFTPRISGIAYTGPDGRGEYKLSILKSGDPEGRTSGRFFFEYEPLPGTGHFIHTYTGDGSPLPSFTGEPERVSLPGTAEALADEIWNALDKDNRISLYVRYTSLSDGKYEDRLINRFG